MANCSIALQILPLGVEQHTVIRIVDDVIDYLNAEGVRMEVGPFETTLEGDFDTLMHLLQECVRLAGRDQQAIFANVKINYRQGGDVLSIEQKVEKHRTNRQ